MRVLLLDEEKITKMTLPEEISGVFFMQYRPAGSKVTRDLIFESYNGKWLLKSTTSITVLDASDVAVNSIYIENYTHLKVMLIDRNEVLNLYCLPTIDNNSMLGTVYTDRVNIGSSSECSIIYNNKNIAPIHAVIFQDNGTWYIAPPSENFEGYIYLNDHRIITPTIIKVGDIVFINGLKVIWMSTYVQVNCPNGSVMFNPMSMPNYVITNYDNTVFESVSDEEASIELYKTEDYFFHTPNLKQHLTEAEILIDPPPSPIVSPDNGLITTSAGLTMLASSFASGFSLINNYNSGTPLIRLIPSAITFVAMLVGSVLMPKFAKKYNARVLQKKEAYRIEKYSNYLLEKENEIITEMNKQIRILNDNYPSILTCLKMFSVDSNFVWSREIKDEDFLEVRLGVGNRNAKIKISAPEEHFTLDDDELYNRIYGMVGASRILENVPITFSLLQNKISAIICNSDFNQAFINTIFTQLTIFHSAADLKIVFLNNKNAPFDLSFAKYLPHAFNEDKSIRFYSETTDEMKSLSAYLSNIFKERMIKKEESNEEVTEEKENQKAYRKFETYYLIVTNDFMNAKTLPITESILNADDNYGFSYLILDTSMKKLPNQCKAFINIINGEGCVMERNLNNQTMFNPEYMMVDMRDIGTKLLNIPLL